MNRHLTTRAIERARWFSELSTALDDGERLLAELIAEKVSPGDTERLRLRLIELRAELGRLNRVSLKEGRIVGPTWPDGNGILAEPSRELHPDWRPQRG